MLFRTTLEVISSLSGHIYKVMLKLIFKENFSCFRLIFEIYETLKLIQKINFQNINPFPAHVNQFFLSVKVNFAPLQVIGSREAE